MKVITEYNPFPGPVLALFAIILIFGYILGFVAGSIATTTDDRKTTQYLERLRR